ncbi:YciO family [Klebsiella pneumoniae subsp. rhinoscleromatis]|nr:YciO family [Klebsiella pneumoniae subsp. rhinoscleromatis]
MSQFFYIHPDNPQARLINQAVEIVRKGGVIVYPTDSGYALGCKIEDKGGDGAESAAFVSCRTAPTLP